MKTSDCIRSLYSELDNKSNLDELDIKRIHDASLSKQERGIMQKEFWLLSDYALRCKDINNNDELIRYGKERLGQTSNIFLLARYNHVLHNLTKDTRYCKTSVDNYILIFKHYVKSKKDGYCIYEVLDWTIKLSKKIRLDMHPIQDMTLHYLRATDVEDKTKIWILKALEENYNVWKPKILDFVPQLCLDIWSRTCDSDYSECKFILETGEFFARKFNKELLPIYYEKLGDNEEKTVRVYDENLENMVIPHYNQAAYQRMMQYYQKAGNREKLRYATAKYNENKVGLRLFKMKEEVELPFAVKEHFTKIFEWADKSNADMLLRSLSIHQNLFFVPHSMLEELWEKVKAEKFSYMKYMSAAYCDINNNVHPTTHEEMYKSQAYGMYLSNSIRWIIRILSPAIKSNRLSYTKVKKELLNHSDFGVALSMNRNGEQFTYSWFHKVDFAIKDFFVQYKKELSGKHSDWRNVTNALTIQFEGILREKIRLHNGETSKIVGNTKDKENVSEMLLDELLRTEGFLELFSLEDKDFFCYVFTNKGYNIRNNVAHGFYLPYDYTSYIAILVFLCLLRLVRYDIKPQ